MLKMLFCINAYYKMAKEECCGGLNENCPSQALVEDLVSSW